MTILDFLDLDEEDSYFTVYFEVQILWNDLRLQYHFLKNNKTFPDSEAIGRLWTPELQFMHGTDTDIIAEGIHIW